MFEMPLVMRWLFLVLVILSISTQQRSGIVVVDAYFPNNMYCFNESERVTAYYADTPTGSVPSATAILDEILDLPTINLLTGGWASAHVMALLLSILLTEKMGVDTTLYPTYYFVDYWDYDLEYPNSWHQWMEEGNLDIVPEISENLITTEMNTMRKTGAVASQNNGVFWVQGVWIPDYMYNRMPVATLYQTWNDTTFRDVFVAQTPAKYSNATLIAAKIPVVFGSVASYASAAYLKGLFQYYNIEVFFNYTGSEVSHFELVQQLYTSGIDFISYAYSPDIMRTVVPLIRVRFPDNPTGLDTDPCVSVKSCDITNMMVQTIWRTGAVANVPEIKDFIFKFKLDITKIEAILFDLYSNATNDTARDYFRASCDWLKRSANREIWSEWISPITRYQCGEFGELCTSAQGMDTLRFILGILGGLAGLLLLAWVSYQIFKCCKDLQQNYGENDDDNNKRDKSKEEQERNSKERKTLMIGLIKSLFACVIGLVDFLTDALSLISIVYLESNRDRYNQTFIISYFALVIIASIVSFADVSIHLRRIVEFAGILRSGKSLLDLKSTTDGADFGDGDGDDDDDDNDSEFEYQTTEAMQTKIIKNNNSKVMVESITAEFAEMREDLKQLRMKHIELTHQIRTNSVAIFVAIGEDIPFAVLNCIALIKTSKEEYVNLFVLFALLFGVFAAGFKAAQLVTFFTQLNEKAAVRKGIKKLKQRKKRLMAKSMAASANASGNGTIRGIQFTKKKRVRRQSVVSKFISAFKVNSDKSTPSVNKVNIIPETSQL